MEANNEEESLNSLNSSKIANKPRQLHETANGDHGEPQQYEPKDKQNLVYLIFYLWGLGTLLPWNFFITAQSYWAFKFRNTALDFTDAMDPKNRSNLQISFTSYLSIASMVPNTIFLILNTFLSRKFDLRTRLLGPLTLIITAFLFTVNMVPVDTDEWQGAFFFITIISVIFIACNSAILQGGTFGLSGLLPRRCTSAIMNGQALGGVVASVANIITLSAGADPLNTALYYFYTALFVLIMCIMGYFLLIEQEYYIYYIRKQESSKLCHLNQEEEIAVSMSVFAVFNRVKMYAICVCLVFTTTLAIFPGLAVLAIPSAEETESATWSKYFIPVLCFLIFNVGDFVGRTLAGWFQLPDKKFLLLTLCTIRLLFVPLIILSNLQPRKNLPVIFEHDMWYGVFMSLLSLTNGYLASQCMMTAPTKVASQSKEVAGAMMAAFLGMGLMLGSIFSTILVQIP